MTEKERLDKTIQEIRRLTKVMTLILEYGDMTQDMADDTIYALRHITKSLEKLTEEE